MRKVLIRILLPFSILFADELQSPAEFLGYNLGDNFTYHHRVVSYFEHVADVASNEENMSMLDNLRKDNLKRAGVITGKASGKKVGIVWLSYNVHGNEANSTEAAMKTIHALANKNNKSTN